MNLSFRFCGTSGTLDWFVKVYNESIVLQKIRFIVNPTNVPAETFDYNPDKRDFLSSNNENNFPTVNLDYKYLERSFTYKCT